MEKTFIKRINKDTGAIWGVIASAVVAVCGRFCPKTQNVAHANVAEETLSSSTAEMEEPIGPIAEASGLGIPGFGEPSIPINPPNGPTLNVPTYYYNGPNVVPYYEQPEFVKDYFSNLHTNFPTNNVGNCGYVAAAMLLSYYDTYWDPDFIPNQYNNQDLTELDSLGDKEFDSPGVKDVYENLNGSGSDAMRDYIYRMLARQDESFVGYLYQTAIEAGVLNLEVDPGTEANIGEFQTIINYYLSKIPTLDGRVELIVKRYWQMDGSTEGQQRTNLILLAREKIEASQPLIFTGKTLKGGSHGCIAYDYGEQFDSMIVHLGGKSSAMSRQECWHHFSTLDAFGYLEISPELRTIPNNKRFKVGAQSYSCHDLDSFVHKEVVIPYEDEEYHAIQCSCGKLRYEKHTFISLSSDTKKCTKCGKIISKPEWSY